MIEMANRLGQLVSADMPFRLDERSSRAQRLVNMLDDSDITNSEKYRLIIEAYQAEIEYGRTTEAYTGTLPDGQRVEFLRIGRTLLFWQATDGSDTGWWKSHQSTIRAAGCGNIVSRSEMVWRSPKNQVAPDLIRLPVPAPVPAESR